MESSIYEDNNNEYRVENNFLNFLNSHRTKVPPYTHTGVGKNAGKYIIEGKDLKIFFNLYSKVIDKNINVHLIEQHTNICPILVDLDFRYQKNILSRQYDKDFIIKIVETYIEQIIKYFDLDEDDQEELVQAFIFERPKPYVSKETYKDGIHLMFPYIVSSPEIQYIIRDNVIKKLTPIFETMMFENSASNIIDRAVINNVGWYMYGSTKPSVERYELTYIFDQNCEEVDIDTYDKSYFSELFSIRNKNETTPIKENYFDEIQLMRNKLSQKIIKKKSKGQAYISDQEIQDIFELISMLSDERADDYNLWLSVGFALHNIDSNSEDLLLIWDDFSRRSSKYVHGACEEKWENMKDNGLGIGSIYHWASTDNSDKYREFRNKQIRTYIEQSMTGTNVDIAKVLHKMYKHDYVCASIKNKRWYRFKRHRWIEDEDGISLRNKISNELVKEYCNLISYYNEKMEYFEELFDDCEDKIKKCELESSIKQLETKIDKLTIITKNLKTTSFIDNIMKECKGLFYNKEFTDKVDENHFLFGFKNGVLDLKTGEFRDGRPEDYMTLSTEIEYEEYSEDMPYLKNIKEFINKVQPNESTRKYMLILLSSLLEGHNADESFHLWTGVGGNGKSKINELVVSCFGSYSTKLPITLLTGKRGASNAASPEVVESKGKRYAYLEEPSEGERINVGLMKEFSGGDKIKGRPLWNNFIEFKPQFKMILFCNEPPKVPADDQGTWRRIKALEFPSKFVDNPKFPNEYRKDKYLSEKIPKWSQSFMALLVHYYFNHYKKDGLFIPNEVVQFTDQYQREMDVYADFFNNMLERTSNKEDKISLTEIYDDFKIWYVENFNSTRTPTKREVKKYFEKKYTRTYVNENYIFGFIKKEEEEDNNS